MDGDPATFSGLAEEATACVKAHVPFEVVPGVSAVTAVPAYAGVPLTGAKTRAVHVVTPGDRRRLDRARRRDDHRRGARRSAAALDAAAGAARRGSQRDDAGGRDLAGHDDRPAHGGGDPGVAGPCALKGVTLRRPGGRRGR